MWDPEPYIDTLSKIAPSALQSDAQLRDLILHTVLRHGERRPDFICEVAQDLHINQRGFVYDRETRLIFFADWADHERTAACLMALRSLRAPLDMGSVQEQVLQYHGEMADRYLEEGYGFIANSPKLTQSSGSWPLNVGSEVMLSPQEKAWFGGVGCCIQLTPRVSRCVCFAHIMRHGQKPQTTNHQPAPSQSTTD